MLMQTRFDVAAKTHYFFVFPVQEMEQQIVPYQLSIQLRLLKYCAFNDYGANGPRTVYSFTV